MKRSGRTSAAALAVVTALPPPADRLAVPGHLGREARRVWHETVASKPSGFFDAGATPLLETFVVATAEHRRLSALVAGLDPLADIELLCKLTRLMDTHALRIGAAATKLRLSNQSRWDSQKAATLAKGAGSSADLIRANYRRLES